MRCRHNANVIDNKELAIPYQADYVLLTGGLPYALEGGRERASAFQRHLHHPMTPDSLKMRGKRCQTPGRADERGSQHLSVVAEQAWVRAQAGEEL